MSQQSKRRRMNFSDEEVFVMIAEVAERRDIIESKVENAVTKQAKKRAWQTVADAVNTVSPTVRNPDEIRKKFVDYRSLVKKKLAAIKKDSQKTGDGPSQVPPLTPTEEAMTGLISNVAVECIPGIGETEAVEFEEDYLLQKFASQRKRVKPGGSVGDPISKRDMFDHLTCLIDCDQETVRLSSVLPSSEPLTEEEVHRTSSLTQPPYSTQQQKHLHHQQEHTEINGPARKRRALMPESSSSIAIKPKIISVNTQRHAEDSPQAGASHNGSGKTAPTSHQSPSNLPTSSAESADEDSTEGEAPHVGCGEPLPTSHQLPSNMPTTSAKTSAEAFEVQHTAKHFGMILNSLAKDELFMDVTLTAEGHSVKAHKSVLSAVSPYFREVLRSNPSQHPVIIMPYNALIEDLKSIISFIYTGELTVGADRLKSILRMGEVLKIEGLCSLGSLERDKAADPCSVLPSSQSYHRNTSKMKPKNAHEASRLHDGNNVSNVTGTVIDVESRKESSVSAIKVKQFAFVAGDDTTSSLQNSALQASKNEPRKVSRVIVRPVAECSKDSTESRGKSDPSYISKTTDVNNFLSGTTAHTNHRPNQIVEGSSSSSQLSWEASSDAVKYECESSLHMESIDIKVEPVS